MNLSTGAPEAEAGQVALAPDSTRPDVAKTDAPQTEVTFPVTGMTCASCVRRIERRLGKVDGVHDVNVNLATEKARVVFDPGLVGLPDLVSAVERAGYGVGELPPDPAAVEVGAMNAGAMNRAPTM